MDRRGEFSDFGKGAEWTLYAVMVAGVIVALTIAFFVLRDIYFDDPPIKVNSLDPEFLGVFCGGEVLRVQNEVEINDSIIVICYISTLDAEAKSNVVGTQSAFTDMLHPVPSTFRQDLPWTVPKLPSGRYTRVFAARNVEGSQRTVFVNRYFEIGDYCN